MSQLVHEGFGGEGRYPEGLRVGLLKLGALLIEFMHKELLDHRKELIKFAWNNIKVMDSNRATGGICLLFFARNNTGTYDVSRKRPRSRFDVCGVQRWVGWGMESPLYYQS